MISMIKTAAISLTFLFLLLFSTPAFAYLPIAMNQSVTLGTCSIIGFSCINNTAPRCIAINDGCGGSPQAYEFNFTGSKTTRTSASNNTMSGFLVKNETFAIAQQSPYCIYMNITAGSNYAKLTDNADCGNLDIGQMEGVYTDAYQIVGGKYDTDWALVTAAPWSSNNKTVMTANQSDNTTLYTTGFNSPSSNIMRWYNGDYNKTIGSVQTLWNIGQGTTSRVLPSLVRVGTTDWLFVISQCVAASCGTEKTFLYRVNFTQALLMTSGEGISIVLNNDSIQNTTVNRSSSQMSIALYSACNGTINWFVDGASVGTTAVTTAPMSDYEIFYFSTGILADGAHNYEVNFTDNCTSSVWSTGKTYFTKGQTGAVSIITDNFSNALGVSAENGKAIFAMILAISLSAGLAYYVGVKMFVPALMGLVLVFAFVGWFPAWMTLVFIVIAGMIFAKTGGFI